MSKPSAIKELNGSYKKNPDRRNDDEPKTKAGIGPAPKFLNEEMKSIWDEVVDQVCIGVLGDSDRFALETLCRLIYDMRFDWEEFNGSKQSNLIKLLGEFGMSPVQRQKLHVQSSAKKQNKFEAI